MEQFKVENFLREHPGENFPEFRALDGLDCERIRAELARKCGMFEVDPLRLLQEVDRRPTLLETAANAATVPDVREVLKRGGVSPGEQVYVNWYRLDEIDEIGFDDLAKYFGDIWYPNADDIELFDRSLSWLLFVRHHGSTKLVSL